MKKAAILRGFEHWDKLDLEGGVLRIDGRIVGFAIGELVTGDTVCVHFEKAFASINGAYPMVCREFVRQILREHPDVVYINREEDLGLPNLRKAKLDCYPVYLLRKYTARRSDERLRNFDGDNGGPRPATSRRSKGSGRPCSGTPRNSSTTPFLISSIPPERPALRFRRAQGRLCGLLSARRGREREKMRYIYAVATIPIFRGLALRSASSGDSRTSASRTGGCGRHFARIRSADGDGTNGSWAWSPCSRRELPGAEFPESWHRFAGIAEGSSALGTAARRTGFGRQGNLA